MEESKDERKWRRGDQKSKLHCKLPQQCSRVVRMTKAIVSSTVNEEEEEEEEDKEVEEESKDDEEEEEEEEEEG